jgi:hypothetical protein
LFWKFAEFALKSAKFALISPDSEVSALFQVDKLL